MVDTPIDPPRHDGAGIRAYAAPVLRQAGWFGFFLILAPLIGPHGYGLFVLALSVIAIADALLAEPATAALVRFAPIDALHWSTASVTMIVAGSVLSLTVYAVTGAMSGAIGAVTDEAGFADLFRSLAMLPLLGAIIAVPTALLRREGRDGALVAASGAALVAGGAIAVALARAGAGPWAFVAQITVQRLVECAALWSIPGGRIGFAWSRRHFADLVRALDWPALAAGWPVLSRCGSTLAVGLALGPTAAGLFALAARLAEALPDMCQAGGPGREATPVEDALRVVLPAVLASTLLALALPPLLDLRWWGAVLPAQIMLLGTIPGAISIARARCVESGGDLWWRATQTLGGIGAVALAASHGLLTAVAVASLVWETAGGLASLWPIRRVFGARWRAMLVEAARPAGAAAAAGALLWVLAGPTGRALAPLPALCLLTASGWLAFIVIRGRPQQMSGSAARGRQLAAVSEGLNARGP